jgi:hypothetical protein
MTSFVMWRAGFVLHNTVCSDQELLVLGVRYASLHKEQELRAESGVL